MTRAERNNNPGNIRISAVSYKGEVSPSKDPAFKEFKTLAMGFRAMFVLIHTYNKRYRLDTISKVISRYAPPSENNTASYIDTVSRLSGIAKDRVFSTLDPTAIIPIVGAMAQVESGKVPDKASLKSGWELFRADFGGSYV